MCHTVPIPNGTAVVSTDNIAKSMYLICNTTTSCIFINLCYFFNTPFKHAALESKRYGCVSRLYFTLFHAFHACMHCWREIHRLCGRFNYVVIGRFKYVVIAATML